MSEKRQFQVVGARQGPNLKHLEYSPDLNPLLEPGQVVIRNRHVSAGKGRNVSYSDTGEDAGVAVIRQIEQKDEAEFVKVFADGIKAAFALSKTAARVFQLVLEQYQAEPMSGGYADSVYLAWFGAGLSGRDVGLSDRTFQRGLRELLAKRFIAPKAPNLFWVNSAMFFKGNRVLFVKEYVLKRSSLTRETRVETMVIANHDVSPGDVVDADDSTPLG